MTTQTVEEFMEQTCPCLWLRPQDEEHSKKDCPIYTFEQERALLTSILTQERTRLKEEIEEVFREEVPPHGLSLEDSVWLTRILNKAFHAKVRGVE